MELHCIQRIADRALGRALKNLAKRFRPMWTPDIRQAEFAHAFPSVNNLARQGSLHYLDGRVAFGSVPEQLRYEFGLRSDIVLGYSAIPLSDVTSLEGLISGEEPVIL